MKTYTTKALIMSLIVLLSGALVLAAETDAVTVMDKDKAKVPTIAAGSPHLSPQLAGLPHIELGEKQKARIELIVKNNQEGVRETTKAIKVAEKALIEAKKEGRPKVIEAAALMLGKAIGEKAVLDVEVVNSILDVLTKGQIAALEEFNKRSAVWARLGLLTVPDVTLDAVENEVAEEK